MIRQLPEDFQQKKYVLKNFIKLTCSWEPLQLYWNHISTWVSPVNLMNIFRSPFPKNTSGRLLLKIKLFENRLSVVKNFWKKHHLRCHCVKSVRIRSYSGLHFSTFGSNNSEYGHFLSIVFYKVLNTPLQVWLVSSTVNYRSSHRRCSIHHYLKKHQIEQFGDLKIIFTKNFWLLWIIYDR